MPRFGMVIDLDRCIGCHACTQACRVEHQLSPGILWNRVEQIEIGRYPAVKRLFVPVHCMHCDDPDCVWACPTGAAHQRDDGVVLIDHDQCIGCQSCMVACPYDVRRLNDGGAYFREGPTPFERVRGDSMRADARQPGTVEKCTFCAHRVDRGLAPACVVACITGAITFGDLDDPDSEISRLLRSRTAERIQPLSNSAPAVYYLGVPDLTSLLSPVDPPPRETR